jgi:hypothetical membrane protein
MKSVRLIRIFNDRYPLVGPAFWILSIQYFITQWVVAHRWATPFSLSHNTISDLGNTACGPYGGRFVCSPLHDWMNASFIIFGLTMVIGAALIYHEFKRSRATRIGFSFMAAAGVGTLLVGLFPENTVSGLHILGAALPFFIGNVGMVILGRSLELPKAFKIYTIFSGLFALIALAFLLTGHYLGLDIGGMERLTAYPQTIWLIVFGIYMSSSHVTSRVGGR